MVFTGYFGSGDSGIFSSYEAIVVSGDVVDGRTLDSATNAILYDSGDLAFTATFDGGTKFGIFTLDRGLIVETGTIIDGKVLTGISTYRTASSGDVAFRAFFSDGSRGMVVGTPSPVPEPASLAIWSALGGLGLIVARRRKRTA